MDSESKLSSGGDPVASAVKKEKDQDDEDEDDDIDKALSNELKNLRSEKSVMKFQRADTGVSNVVFISTTVSLTHSLIALNLNKSRKLSRKCHIVSLMFALDRKSN